MTDEAQSVPRSLLERPGKTPDGPGAATLAIEEAEEAGIVASPRARARAMAADAEVAEGTRILDEYYDVDNPAASVARAKNRAEWRWRKAATLARSVYGEQVKIDATVQVAAIVAFADMAPRQLTEAMTRAAGVPVAPTTPVTAYQDDQASQGKC